MYLIDSRVARHKYLRYLYTFEYYWKQFIYAFDVTYVSRMCLHILYELCT